jgi:galactose oxidase
MNCLANHVRTSALPTYSAPQPKRRTQILLYLLALAFFALLAPAKGHAQIVRTGYSNIAAASSDQCLTISGASTAAGAGAVQYPCSSAASQEWTVEPYGSGTFRILEEATGDCLVVSGAATYAGVQLVQEPCTGVNNELWSFVAQGNYYQAINKNSGECMSVSGGSLASSDPITQWPCATASNFLWSFTTGLIEPTALTVAQAAHSGQCMNVNEGLTTAGAAIIQYPCAGSANEQWYIKPSGNYYQLAGNASGLCVSNNGSAATATAIVQETCSATSTSDLWTLTPIGGSYEMIGANGGLCLTIAGASQTAATAVTQAACTGAQDQLWSLSAATLPSSWTGVIPLAVDPIGASQLTDGQLVMWSANDQYTFQGDIGYSNSGQTYSTVFDPVAETSSVILVTNTGDDMFCPGTANLFNGDLLVNGGDSSPKTSIYDQTTGNWTFDSDMNIPRGYEADTVLTNGSVLTFGGSWSGGQGGKTAEVWTQGSGWNILTNVPETNIIGPDPQGVYRGDNHLWLFDAPNGEVFHAGPSANMNWITTSGAGSITPAGNRGNDPYAINGNAVLYDVGMIMKTGGAPAYQDANAEANTYLININGGVGNVTVNQLAPMAYPRAFSNGVVLPNGQVVILGGQTYPVPFSDATAILVPEIWDPLTQVFRQLNPNQTPRVYHSTGLLLADGRVYSGGGGQCGEGCTANHFNAEILTPPYLLNPDGSAATRPVISFASSSVELGGTISATTAAPVVSFVLMRLSSTTHTVNNDQRRIPLQVQSANGNSYVLSVPSNPGIVLPGNYWLFAINDQGVPSVAANVFVTPQPSFTLAPSASSLLVAQGTTGTDTITVNSIGGFSGGVTLTATGLPAGVTASFSANPANGSSIVTFTVAPSAVSGASTVTITGTSGTLTASTAITLTLGTCTPTPIVPYLNVNAAGWQEVSTASVAAGATVNLGPQPIGGTWSWSGPNGFTSASREIDGIPLLAGINTFVASYTNANSCVSTQSFVITESAAASFTLASSPGAVSVAAGGSAGTTVTVTGSNGFTGAVTLAASGLPTGVTVGFGTNPATGSSTVTFSASNTAAAGTSQVTISGTSGTLTATAIVALTVTGQPGFTLSASPASVSVVQGASGASTVTVAPANGFTGSVLLDATGLPTGVTASFGTNPATGSSVVTFTAASTAAIGTSQVTITGTSGTLTSTAIVSLTVTAAPSFTLSSPASVSVVQGATAASTVTVAPANGFTGAVTLAASGLPTGVTAAFGTNPATTSSVVTFTSSGTAAKGSYTVTVTGTSGALTASTTIALTVTAAPSFTLSSSPASVSVAQAANAASTVAVAPANGFTGSVTLAASGLPTGITAAFGTNPTTASSTVTFTASSIAAKGSYTVTITGTSGTLTASTTIALTVTAAACTPTAITPYLQVNGAAWQEVSSATVASGAKVNLGPQPLSGGSWSWAGPGGRTSTYREIDNIYLATGVNTYVATYTNSASCKSTQTFTITVN